MRTFNVAILLCFFHLSFAKNLVLETEKDNILIGEYVEYFQADRSLEFKEAIQSNLWQQSQAEVLNFGSTSKAIWIKLTVENRSTDDLFYLELNMPYLDHFELFQKDQNGKYSSEVVGDIYRFSNREVRSVLPTFKVKHNRKSIQTYYLRVFGNESITLPIHLEGKHEWKQNKSQKDQFFGFYTGIFVLINVFSIILILIIRKTILLYYLIYSFLVYFAQTFTIVGTSQWIATDISKYMDIIQSRLKKRQNGANWLSKNFSELLKGSTPAEASVNITKKLYENQEDGSPVHSWKNVRPNQVNAHKEFKTVNEIMETDLFTVNEDDLLDLVVHVMDWQQIRHVPVENSENQLVGMINSKCIIRFLSQKERKEETSAKEIMITKYPKIHPSASTNEAIRIMAETRSDALPVVMDDGTLLGIITESDIVQVANMTGRFSI